MINQIRKLVDDNDRVYPCADCNILRSKNEGGTVFTVCDECWDRHWHEIEDVKESN